MRNNKKATNTKATKASTKPAAKAVQTIAKPEAKAAKAEKPAAPKLANNASENAVFPFILKLNPIAGSGALAASVPFHALTVEQAKAGKITNKTARVDAYLALYTQLADASGKLPNAGDKSVMATLLASGDIKARDGSFYLVNKLTRKAGEAMPYNAGFTAELQRNDNHAKRA